VRAAAAVEAVLAEEAALMAEALAEDVALAMTLLQQMQTTADNKQQSINK